MDAGDLGAAPFLPCSAVVLSELGAEERRRYLELLAKRETSVARDGGGRWVANVRILAPGLAGPAKQAPAAAEPTRAKSAGPGKGVVTFSARKKLVREAKRSPAALLESVEDVVVGGVDCALYPRFSSLVLASTRSQRARGDTSAVAKPPRVRPLSWLMRLIEEIYDARYARDTAELARDKGNGGDDGTRLFPVFVIDHLSKRYGLEKIVEATCWDLLCSAHAHRQHLGDVEIFARFLQELYDADDVLFFLYVRSVVGRVLGVNLRARWATDALTGGDRVPKELWLSFRECVTVAKLVFDPDDTGGDAMYADFLATVEAHCVGLKRATADTRRVEVSQFLTLAVVGYHQDRPEEPPFGGAPPRGPPAADGDAELDARYGDDDGDGGAAPAPVATAHPQLAYSPPQPAPLAAYAPAAPEEDDDDAVVGELLDVAADAYVASVAAEGALGAAVVGEIRGEVLDLLGAKVDALLAQLPAGAPAPEAVEDLLQSPPVRAEVADLVSLLATYAAERLQ